MELPRSSGILLHITSLPSPFGIGDLGPSAYEFIEFLRVSGHRFWQLLPLNPTSGSHGHSPYSSFSAFGGNPLLISPQLLEKEGFISLDKHPPPKFPDPEKVDFDLVEKYKMLLLSKAFQTFNRKGLRSREYSQFCEQQAHWLEDHALYVALQKSNRPWPHWPRKLRDRDQQTLVKAKAEYAEKIEKEKFIQFLFHRQWESLRKFARSKKVEFFGDIPFYVNLESVDCWANQELFKLGKDKKPTALSGVPPDYFSETGQLWGTPVFDWRAMKKRNFSWWNKRISQNLELFDLVRLDHFRAFSGYWEVPAGHQTAIKGKWVRSPGQALFQTLKEAISSRKLVAEDLGELDEGVYQLISRFDLPGMRVLQFAFGEDMPETIHIPHWHQPNNIVYPGTHDNPTAKGWYEQLSKAEKKDLNRYTGKKVRKETIHKILHRLALSSVCHIAITPLQDILGLGPQANMNIPGTTEGNWSWRLPPDTFLLQYASDLRKLNQAFGRLAWEKNKEI